MYVSLEEASPCAISNFGFYFADNSIDTITNCHSPLSYLNPQIENPINNIITDTLNWVPITGTFVATGNEKYLVLGNFETNAITTKSFVTSDTTYSWAEYFVDDISCIDVDLPANAGLDTICLPGTSVYIGRPQDVGIDEACTWFQLPNLTTAIDTAAGLWVSPVATTTYVVRQEICGNVKWDTVVVHQTAVGLEELKLIADNLKIYPVPAQDEITLQFTLPNAEEQFKNVSIYNNLGQLMREEEATFKNKALTLKTDDLANGVYQLQLRSGNAGAVSKRFVVSR